MKHVSNESLRTYIESQGAIVPDFFVEHDLGEPKDHQCVFCNSTHLSEDRIQLTGPFNSIMVTCSNIAQCTTCEYSVEFSTVDFTLSEDMKIGAGHLVAMNIVADRESNKKVTEATEETLTRLARYGTISLDKEFMCYPGGGHHLCLGCNTINSYSDITDIKIPIWPLVGEFQTILGPAQLCTSCNDRMEVLKNEFRVQGLLGARYIDTCCNCNTIHQINEEEINSRVEIDTVSEYLCHRCAIKEGMLKVIRFTESTCINETCQNTRVIDVLLNDIHQFDDYICPECEEEHHSVESITHHWVVEDRIGVFVYKDATEPYYFFQIEKVNNSNIKNRVFISSEGHPCETIHEALSRGIIHASNPELLNN